jgi:hypothetical protein
MRNFSILLFPFLLSSQEILIKPYLQNTTTNSICVMWEINQKTGEHVEWGETEELGNITNAISEASQLGNYILNANITNLSANTQYYYRAVNEDSTSDLYNFYTNNNTSSESQTNIITMSDMQIDGNFPNKFYEVVHSGILNYIESEFDNNINEHVDLILRPGDLVENGLNYEQW